MDANHGVAGFNGGNVRTNSQWLNVKEVGKKMRGGAVNSKWWALPGSNRGPNDYESCALTN